MAYSSALYEDGGNETVTLQGLAYSTTLYEDGGSETVTLRGSPETVYPRGNKVSVTLYTYSSGTYTPVAVALYYGGPGATTYYGSGGSRTFYKRGNPKGGLYSAGTSKTFYKRGNPKGGLYSAGTSETVTLQGEPAVLDTETVTALTV